MTAVALPERRFANAIRALAMDAVQKANSGHPGAPMGMAEIAVALWAGHYRHNPTNPTWVNRDRFVLSNGHGSMLLYSLLHLSGYDLPIEELKNFRQLHSKTPGHPEYGILSGIETTTGPLGQGFGNAVGMALAEAMWDAYNESVPKQLKAGEWHIPFGDDINLDKLEEYANIEILLSLPLSLILNETLTSSDSYLSLTQYPSIILVI